LLKGRGAASDRRCTLATLLPSAVLREHRGLVTLPVTPALPQRTVALLKRLRASSTLAANAFSDVLLATISQEGLGEA
ncbi:hypothetical protein ACLFKT_27350, partial [Paraburkholderia sp. BR14261]